MHVHVHCIHAETNTNRQDNPWQATGTCRFKIIDQLGYCYSSTRYMYMYPCLFSLNLIITVQNKSRVSTCTCSVVALSSCLRLTAVKYIRQMCTYSGMPSTLISITSQPLQSSLNFKLHIVSSECASCQSQSTHCFRCHLHHNLIIGR